MPAVKVKTYKEQRFDQLKGLDGISDDQIAEHLDFHAVGEMRGIGWAIVERRLRDQAAVRPAAA